MDHPPKRERHLNSKHPEDRPDPRRERLDFRVELYKLEAKLSELKVLFEQFFSGLIPYAPDKLHTEVKQYLRIIRNAPFKTSEVNFKLRALEQRYHTFNNYWTRVLRQREEGTYHKDVFRASLRERNALEDARAETEAGVAERSLVALFKSYKTALEKTTGQKQNLDFKTFEKSLLNRARDFKEKHKVKKVNFKVVVKDGKVAVQARAK